MIRPNELSNINQKKLQDQTGPKRGARGMRGKNPVFHQIPRFGPPEGCVRELWGQRGGRCLAVRRRRLWSQRKRDSSTHRTSPLRTRQSASTSKGGTRAERAFAAAL